MHTSKEKIYIIGSEWKSLENEKFILCVVATVQGITFNSEF